MKNEMTLSVKTIESGNSVCNNTVTPLSRRMVAPLTRYYSRVLGTKVTPRQTLLLLNAQVAFLFAVLPADCPMLLRCVCGGWLVSALLKCKGEFS